MFLVAWNLSTRGPVYFTVLFEGGFILDVGGGVDFLPCGVAGSARSRLIVVRWRSIWGSEWGGPVVTGWVGLEVLCSGGRGVSFFIKLQGFTEIQSICHDHNRVVGKGD
jgi:hypothetical protein